MGPIIIFDKSFLQSLSVDEAVIFDLLFQSNITPLFLIETLADLEKEMKKGRRPEDIVGNLSYKTPEWGKVNVHHQRLLWGELSGQAQLDMKYGRPHIGGGRMLELDGKKGVIYEESPEEEAFSRWAKGQFLDAERLYAKTWRNALSSLDLERSYKIFQQFFKIIKKPKSLVEAKKEIDIYIDTHDELTFKFGLALLGIPDRLIDEVLGRWKSVGSPSIRIFAPYFTHVFSVELFFYLSIASDLISRGRASNKADIAYLYYLPFCMVFVSGDKLHLNTAPLFLRSDQSFVYGPELKQDLLRLDKYYNSFSEEEKERGLFHLATYPPDDYSFLTTQLWDRHMSSTWRENKINNTNKPNKFLSDKFMKEMKRFEAEGKPITTGDLPKGDQLNHMLIKRMVHGKKGKWKILPPEVMNRRKNEHGDRENITPNK